MNTSTEQPEQLSTLEVIHRFHQAFNSHDVPAVMALMTDDCLFENTFPAPDGSRLQGQAAVRSEFESFFRSSPQAWFEVEEVFAAGDRGALRWLYSWVDEHGSPGHVRGVDIFRVRDGKVSEKLSYVKG